jgi:hypothetical protein
LSAPRLILSTELPGARGGLATAAAVAVELATAENAERRAGAGGAVLLAEVGAGQSRGPTMLASDSSRSLEQRLRDADLEAAARGRLVWVPLGGEEWLERLGLALDAAGPERAALVHLPPTGVRAALESDTVAPSAALVRAELPAQRALAALAVAELRAAGLRVRVAPRPPGRVAARRALAGIDPGGEASRRATRLARGLAGGSGPGPPGRRTARLATRLAADSGQALPLALGGVLALIFCALLLAAFGGATTGKSRTQRAADLVALSAARSMRDDFERLFTAARRPDGSVNPAHLGTSEYLRRASRAARKAGERNGIAPRRLEVEFPDADSFAPLRVRAEVTASLAVGALGELPVAAEAEAEAVPPAGGAAPAGAPATASGGGYAGPLAHRQGVPMRPDVAAAFDRLAAAAARTEGLSLIVNSGFRSDAEQAALFAQNPDPQWVAPPGTSLHRCATELDLGPPSAYGWLAANAGRFGFLKRYAWEPWHFGYSRGPAPCSAAGDNVGADGGDGAGSASAGGGLPAYVPARYRKPIAEAARRWNVSAALLAAQLMAESNFNPFAVSSAGANGIAQFMPGTAAAYGLDDPFDAEAAIDAQAHLMSDLLAQFGQVPLALAAYNAGPAPVEACSCIPPYPETRAYVARILGLMAGAGAIAAPPQLEVRLVE